MLFNKAHQYIYKSNVQKKYHIDENVSFPSTVAFNGKGTISVGKDTYFGANCCIVAHPKEAEIAIGTRYMIALNVHFGTASHDVMTLDEEIRKLTFGNIKIGNNVWIV